METMAQFFSSLLHVIFEELNLADCVDVLSFQSINQSIIYFNTLRQRAKKLVQNTNVVIVKWKKTIFHCLNSYRP